MTVPASPDEWNLSRLQELVVQHELERGRIEYKGELGNGHRTLEAIAALANTFGGVVLVGVDERKEGADRLVGVDAGTRDRLARMCWDQLVPPYSPEIIPIKLDYGDRYVLAVLVNPDHARRPIMHADGNKIPVRIDGHNVPADWYRLQALFAEQQTAAPLPSLPGSGNFVPGPGAIADLGLRARLLLSGQRNQAHHISQAARTAILAALNDKAAPLTGTNSGGLAALMFTWGGGKWSTWGWALNGRAGPYLLNAQWDARTPNGHCLTQATLTISLNPGRAHGDTLIITLETLLTNPKRAVVRDGFKASSDDADDREVTYLGNIEPAPFVHLGHMRQLIGDTLATLWGPLGAAASSSILGQPLGAPAQIDLAVFTIGKTIPSQIPLNNCLDFGTATLIPGNIPVPWTDLGPIRPDRQLLNQVDQERLAHEWATWLALHNGYDNIEQELARHASAGA